MISSTRARWPRAVAVTAGLILAGLGTYVLVRSAAPEGVHSNTAWDLFFGAFLDLAAAASIAGAAVTSPALGARLLAITTGAFAGLTFVLVFSIGLLLLPFAIGTGLAAAATSRGTDVSAPSLVLAGAVPVLVLFLGLFSLYR